MSITGEAKLVKSSDRVHIHICKNAYVLDMHICICTRSLLFTSFASPGMDKYLTTT